MKISSLHFPSKASLIRLVPFIVAIAIIGGNSAQAQSTWQPTNGTAQSWQVPANWSPNGVPNGTGVTANLESALTANETVNLNGAVTLGTLNIGATSGTSKFTLNNAATATPANTLTMDSGAGTGAFITDIGAGDSIGSSSTLAPGIIMADTNATTALTISSSSAGTFTVNSGITSAATGSNLLLQSTGGPLTMGGLINNSGTVTNNGTAQLNLIGGLGSNVTAFTSNNTAGSVFISGNVTVGNGGLTITAGTTGKGITFTTGSVSGTGNLVLVDNNASGIGATGITTKIDNVGTLTNQGSGAATDRLTTIVTNNVTGIIENNNGTGKLELDGVNTFNGPITITSGTVIVGGASGVLGSGSYSGLVADGGTLQLSSGAAQTVSGAISGTGALTVSNAQSATIGGVLTQTGDGLVVLSGANTFSGATTVSNGVLNLQNNGALGTGAVAGTNSTKSVTVSSGGDLQLQGGITTTASVGLSLSGAGSLFTGTGSGVAALENVSGTNTYTGAVTLKTGPVTIASDAGTLILSNTAAISGATDALTLAGAGNGSIAASLTTTSGFLTKSGAGTWTLSGTNNNYTGTTSGTTGVGTFINGGTLNVMGALTSNLNGVNVGNGTAVATLAGTGTIAGDVATLSSGANIAHVAPGASPNTVGTLNIGSTGEDFSVGSGTEFDFDLGSSTTVGGTTNDLIHIVAGTNAVTFAPGTDTFAFNMVGGSLATGTAYTLIDGSVAPLSGVTFNATGIGSDTAVFSVVGGVLEVTFSGGASPLASGFYNGTTSQDLTTAAAYDTTATGSTLATSAPTSATDITFSNVGNTSTTPFVGAAGVAVHSVTFGNGSGVNSGLTIAGPGTLTVGGGGIKVTSGTDTINAPVALSAAQTWANAGSGLLTVGGGVTGTGNLAVQDNSTGSTTLSGGSVNHVGSITNSGTGSGVTTINSAIGSNVTTVTQNSATSALVLGGANNYAGGTSVLAGTLYVNNASFVNTATDSSGTGTGAVTVASGATLAGSGVIKPTGGAGVTISSGATLASGSNQKSFAAANGGNGAVNGTGTGGGLTIDNSEGSSSALNIQGGAKLTFALGSTTPYNGGSGALNFASPNTDSTYLSLVGGTVDQIFANTTVSDTINLVDLTNGASPGSNSLTLRSQNPYLLISSGLNTDADFANLVTTGGMGVNGYVLGVSNGSGGVTAFTLGAYDINGNLIGSSTNLENLQLYLFNGNLEVVPEPSTWALMFGGLALLVVIQRRKRNENL